MLLGFGSIVMAVGALVDAIKGPKIAAARQMSAEAQRKQELAIEDSLATEDAITARCGAPHKIIQGISSADARGLDRSNLKGATTLIYSLGDDDEMHVVLIGNTEIPVIYRQHIANRIYPYVPYKGLVAMGCIKETSMK